MTLMKFRSDSSIFHVLFTLHSAFLCRLVMALANIDLFLAPFGVLSN
jgi:hypothetical protein